MMDDATDTFAHGACEAVVKVALKDSSYPVFIGDGLIASAGQFIDSALPGARIGECRAALSRAT